MRWSREEISKGIRPTDSVVLLFLIAFWILMGSIEFLRNFMAALAGGSVFNYRNSLTFASVYSASWIGLTYPIYRVFQKVNRGSWLQKLSLQAVLGVLIGLCHVVLLSLMFSYVLHVTQGVEEPFPSYYFRRISSNLLPASINSIFTYWVVAIILFAFDSYGKYREQVLVSYQLESQLTQAQIQALKMQLQPHFLFNAHNTISMLIRTGKYGQAVDMISGLSDLLRTFLLRESAQMVALQDELNLIRKYLEIEQVRFEDRLNVKFEVGEGTDRAFVPNLILQPIIENAFKHGFARSLGPVELWIASCRRREMLALSVHNSGPFLPEFWNLERDKGVGLTSTVDRLNKLFDSRFVFDIHNEYDGVTVEILIPFQTAGSPDGSVEDDRR